MFDSILNDAANTLSYQEAVLCTGTSLLCGLVIAFCYYLGSVKNRGSKNFCISLIILPAMVQTVIMLVNGNLGAGVAIMGAFSLVRFRSIPGNSRDISTIFLAMTVGLSTGMGYLTYGVFITALVGVILLGMRFLPLFGKKEKMEMLRITIYENLDYTGIFDDLFDQYLAYVEQESVKTVNMGSMYQITYHIIQKDKKLEKEFIDAVRTRNGNLTVVCGRIPALSEEL
ncbi:MAG: DUF4956 domain-containing protein [Lachnospiraceae bacterium]|nr:DUF4956 domain-containing protein [Lachnospiraceae bacterium]